MGVVRTCPRARAMPMAPMTSDPVGHSRRLREQAATERERCAELTQRLAQTRLAIQRAREADRDLLGVDPEANSGPTGDPPDRLGG